jgi:PAS domain S-box-containing protein
MTLGIFIAILPYLLSMAISGGVAAYIWRRRSMPGAAPYAAVAFTMAAWTLFYLIEVISPGLQTKIFWDNMQWITAMAIPFFLLQFTLEYTHLHPRHLGRWQALLIVTSLALLILTFAGQAGVNVRLQPGTPLALLVYDFNLLSWLMTLYVYALTLASMVLLGRYLLKIQPLYRAQTATVLLGISLPMIGELAGLSGFLPNVVRDTTPLTFALGNLIVFYGMFRLKMFDVVPIARETVVESMADAVLVIDTRNRVVDLNPASRKFTTPAHKGVIGQQIEEVLAQYPEIVTRLQQPEPESFHTELFCRRPDGASYVDMRVTPLQDRRSTPIGRLLLLRDITDRKEAEQGRAVLLHIVHAAALTGNLTSLGKIIHQQLNTLLDAANFSIALYNEANGEYSFPYAVDRFEPPEAWLPQPLPNSLTDYVRRHGQPLLVDAALHQQLAIQGEVEFIGPDSPVWLGVPLKVGRNVIGVVAVQSYNDPHCYTQHDLDLLAFASDTIAMVINRKQNEQALTRYRDHLEELVETRAAELGEANTQLREEIAERQRAEAVLQQYATQLEQSNQELQEFAYVASHDLQEPLRKVQTFGQRLASSYEAALDERGQDYLRRMMDAAARMQELIQGLLDFSRVTTHGQTFHPVDLNHIIAGILVDLELQIEERHARIMVGDLPVVHADATQMRQLFQNLLHNALKFQANDTVPEISISSRPALSGDGYEISVADNGIGFEEKYAERIFQVFQRLHGRSSYAGTGMGLAICRRIAERHGGSITAHSRAGQGATFIVTLFPARRAF